MICSLTMLFALKTQEISSINLNLIRRYEQVEARLFEDGSNSSSFYVQTFVFLGGNRWFREVLEIDPKLDQGSRIHLSTKSDNFLGVTHQGKVLYADKDLAAGPYAGKNGVFATIIPGGTTFENDSADVKTLPKSWQLAVPLTGAVWDHEASPNLLAVVGKTPRQANSLSHSYGAVYWGSDQEWTPALWDGTLHLYKMGLKDELTIRKYAIKEKVLGDIHAICFMGSDEILLSANFDLETEFNEGTLPKLHERRIYILDLTTGEVDFVHRMADSRMEGRMAVSADNQYLVYCADGRSLELFKITRLGESQQ